jgi:hypothetical protein
MALKNMSLLAAATVAASGGSALAFAEDGQVIQNGLSLIVPTDVDYATRRRVTVKNKQPTLDVKTGVYGKDKKSMSLSKPLVLTDGRVIFNVIRCEREVHPNLPAADVLELNKLMAQMLVDADAVDFWAIGTLS